MGQEIVVATETLAAWKQLILAACGFVVRFLWFWENPVNWLRLAAAFIFMLTLLYFNGKYVPNDPKDVVSWSEVGAMFIGFYSNNIIKGLFRFWKVNEDGLMTKTKNWWNSDRH